VEDFLEELTAEEIQKIKWAWLDRKDRERLVKARDGSFLSRADVKSLQDKKAPNQKVIIFYLKKMQKKNSSDAKDSQDGDCPKCMIVDTYFHSQVLGNDRIRLEKAKKYFLDEMDLKTSDKLLVPVYDKKKQGWYLLVVNFARETIDIYDPFRLHQKETVEDLAAFLKEFTEHTASEEEEDSGEEEEKGSSRNIIEFEEQQLSADLNSNEEFDLSDTGVLLMEFVDQACRGDSITNSLQGNIQLLRRKKLLEMLADSVSAAQKMEAEAGAKGSEDQTELETPTKKRKTAPVKGSSSEPQTPTRRKRGSQKKESSEPDTPTTQRKLRRRK